MSSDPDAVVFAAEWFPLVVLSVQMGAEHIVNF